jgi:hypothetical protein
MQTAEVTWILSTATNIVSYKLYYGVASRTYTNKISVGNVTNLLVSGLADGTTYYFATTAVKSMGAERAFSPETSYVVPIEAATLTSTTSARSGFSFSVSGISGYI